MTATIVDGYHVIADRPAPSPLPHPTDPTKTLYFKTIRHLVLSNMEVVYGCVDCTYTADTTFKVRAHRSHHAVRRATPPTTPSGGGAHRATEAITVDNLVARLSALSKVEGDRDRWRTRAIAAERRLAALHRALASSAR